MADYATHKAAVDAAHPTPTPTWHLFTDDPSHDRDDHALASTEMIFGERFTLKVQARGSGENLSWSVSNFKGDHERAWNWARGQSWAELQASFRIAWDGICEGIRVELATEAYARETLVADGITWPSLPAATAATATLAGLMPHGATLTHWTLRAHVFDADTLAYAFDSSNDTFVPVAELGFAGQTVFWKHGSEAYVGMAPVITLTSGENVITITVVSADGQNVKTYTLTVTRP